MQHLNDHEADVVIGSKRHVQSRIIFPLRRRIFSQMYHIFTKLFFKLPVGDTQSGMKLFKREVLKKIGQSHIDILAVAYGPGKQERWIKRNIEKIDVKLAIGVGGSLDFISMEKRRAPKWVQNIGLEWLFRLVNEPSRWKRQLALPVFILLFFIEKLSKSKFR